jgi:hypothetical protein
MGVSLDKDDRVPLVALLSSVVDRSETLINPKPESTVDDRKESAAVVGLAPFVESRCLVGRRFSSIRYLSTTRN